LRTVRERWELGAPLTARDAAAADIAPVLSLDRPRAPEDWPDAVPLPVPPFHPQVMPGDVPLRTLARGALLAAMECGKRLGLRVPDLDRDADILRSDGMALVSEYFSDMFPHLRGE
jgi:phospholipase C